MTEVQLKVSKAYPNDNGRGIARLDPDTLMKLQVSPGDYIEIEGEEATLAKVWRSDSQDWDSGSIRIDGFTRQNADVSIGDAVVVRTARPGDAEKVVLAPPRGKAIQFRRGAEDMVKRQLLKRPVVKGDVVPVMSSMQQPFTGKVQSGQTIPLVAVSTSPDDRVVVTESTEVALRKKPVKGYEEVKAAGVTYEDIGGLQEEVQRVRELIELPLRHPELFQRLGIDPPKGVLLYGPPGTGKTLIAKAVSNESGASFFSIKGPEIMSKYYGESEEQLRDIFKEAKEESPSIIFIDEVDSIAPKREEVMGEVERRVVAQLLSLMDGLEERGEVVVIGATNRIEGVDPALRRPGRFDRELMIGVPDRDGRREIFQIHTRGMPLADEGRQRVDMDEIVDITHGFVGADIEALSKEAGMKALSRYLPDIDLEQDEIERDVLDSMYVEMKDFKDAMKLIEPSALREIVLHVPTVTWEGVGGLEDVKQKVKEMVEWPLTEPDRFHRMGIEPPRGVLLYGPPGTGKTLIAKAVSHESEANFIYIKGPELLSKWVGESEKGVRETFKKARQTAPTIIFFDELDAIAPRRGEGAGDNRVTERVVNQILTEMDGLEELEDVIVIGATNRPDIIDPALFRPGRFERRINVPVPGIEARVKILEIHTGDVPLSDDFDLDEMSEKLEGYTGSDIEGLVREAAMIALRDDPDADEVTVADFVRAISEVPPSATEEMQAFYSRLEEQFTSGVEKGEEQLIGYR
ncbi:MAG: VCP-like ATPase [Methanonatronarchaeales archaeon]|nr:VCP-like ATPase [Methanonatronarchaeales archaeon]